MGCFLLAIFSVMVLMTSKIKRYAKESKLFRFIWHNNFYNTQVDYKITFRFLSQLLMSFFTGITMQVSNNKKLLFSHFFYKYVSYGCYGLAILFLLGLNPSYALSAEATVKKFYDYVESKRCFDAVKLRPDYSLDSCENIDKIYVHKVKLAAEDQHYAVVLVELDIEMNGKNTYFNGHTLVKKNNKKWHIVGPYKSKTTFDVDEYIAEYIPQGLHAKGEHKQVSSAPAKKTPDLRELPPGDAIDESPNVRTRTSIASASVNTPVATTDPLSAQPVGQEEQHLPQKLQQLTLKGAKPLQHNKAMGGYFLGNIAIQGNFIGLVDNLRDLFPELAQHVILVDKSQSILYFYKEKNALAGFFPILTVAISDFPSGLYQIAEGNKNTDESSKPLSEQEVSQGAIRMEKLELSKEQQILVSDYYYLRNYFDKNQKQSLSLSPIDNSKLQQLIQTKTLVYIAE